MKVFFTFNCYPCNPGRYSGLVVTSSVIILHFYILIDHIIICLNTMRLGLVRSDFNLHTGKFFGSLLEDDNFTDVTLVCEGHRQIRAHKAILSSGSNFFKELLVQNIHPHPLIYFKLKYADVDALVRFIYLGQCEVEQSHIDNFMSIARDLEVEGLTSTPNDELYDGFHIDEKLEPNKIEPQFESYQTDKFQVVPQEILFKQQIHQNPIQNDVEKKEDRNKTEHCKDVSQEIIENIDFRLVRGNRGGGLDNPGKLIVKENQKYLFNKRYGNCYHYHCYKKQYSKCTAKVKLELEVDNGKEMGFKIIAMWDEHNHDHDLEKTTKRRRKMQIIHDSASKKNT